MKVELISIGTELLLGNLLDINLARATRRLRELDVAITCKVTVGDDVLLILDAFRTALGRADILLAMGGLGDGANDLTRQAVTTLILHELEKSDAAAIVPQTIGPEGGPSSGLMVELASGTLICLPGDPREMAYLLETEVLPHLHRDLQALRNTGWLLLRTAGIMESSLARELAEFNAKDQRTIKFDSFAGQTTIRLRVEGENKEDAARKLHRLKGEVMARLGDHVFGEGRDRIEQVILDLLRQSGIRAIIAECDTGRRLVHTMSMVPESERHVASTPTASPDELAEYLDLPPLERPDEFGQWCREAAERLRHQADADVGLLIYKHVTGSGIQILAALASNHGVSVTSRTFGGHPENIDQWASTLGLAHLRRWLLVNR